MSKNHFFIFILLLSNIALNGQYLNVTKYDKSQGLLNSGITSVGFDKHNNQQWIGTLQQGFYYSSNGKILPANIGNNVVSKMGYNIVTDDKGDLWCLHGYNELIVNKIVDNKIDTINVINFKQNMGSSFDAFIIVNYNDTSILYKFDGRNIYKFNLKNKKVSLVRIANDAVVSRVFANMGNILLSTNQGVFEIALNGKIIQKSDKLLNVIGFDNYYKQFYIRNGFNIEIYNANYQKINQFSLPKIGIETNDIKVLSFKSNLLFYSFNKVVLYNTKTNQSQLLGVSEGLLSNGCRSLSLDRENNIWICQNTGLCKISNIGFNAYDSKNLAIPNDDVSVIKLNKDKNFFLGGKNYCALLDSKFAIVKQYTLFENENKVHHKYRLLDGVFDENKSVYFTFNSNIGVIDKNFNLKFLDEKNNNLYLSAVLLGHELYYQKNNQLIVKSNLKSIDLKGIATARKLFVKSDTVLVVCSGSGAYEININSGVVTQILKDASTYGYEYDRKNKDEYYGTNKGLFIKHINSQMPTLIKKVENYQVYALKFDNIGRLWFGANDGTYIYSPENNSLIRVNDFINLVGTEVSRSAFEYADGFMWVGTNGGVNKIPVDFEIPSYVPPTFIKNLEVNQVAKEMKNDSIFKYNENEFKFTFGLNSNINEKENLISFKLIGFDNDWSIPSKQYEVRYTNLSPGFYTFKVKAWNVFGKQAKIAVYSFEILKPWWQMWWFYLLSIILIVGLLIVITLWRIKVVNEKLLSEKKVVESELKALRTQINPHYLSNSLVSLQKMVLNNNKMLAFETLSQYGKVMRNILQFSETQFTPLLKEISTLQQYIILEGMLHFENPDFKITYNTINDDEINRIEIPTMLIQPFIENAIIHGLLNKKEGTHELLVEFTFANKILTCIIRDNGVGRKPKMNQSERKSMGNKNVEDRLRLYGNLLNQNAKIEIADLIDEQGKANGTKVVINLPYKFTA